MGDGLLRGEVRDAGITPRTLLTGLRRDVPELMAAFDVFVLTSLWEGLPRLVPANAWHCKWSRIVSSEKQLSSDPGSGHGARRSFGSLRTSVQNEGGDDAFNVRA